MQELERAQAAYRERVVAVDAAKARLDAHAKIEQDALEAAELEAGVRNELRGLPTELQMQKAILDETELRQAIVAEDEAVRAWHDANAAYRAAFERGADLLGRASALNEEAQTLRTAADHALAHVGEATCDLCSQVLGAQAAADYAKRSREQAETHDFTAKELDAEAAKIELPKVGPEPGRNPSIRERHVWASENVQRLQTAYMQRPRLEERLAGYLATTAKAKTPEYRTELELLRTALSDAEVELAAIPEPEPGADDVAKAAALTRRSEVELADQNLTRYRDALARVETSLVIAQRQAADLERAKAEHAELVAERDLLATLERAFGRDGIPALIVEVSAIPTLEAEANRILAELGTPYRIELRTQRALKSGDGLADTLDVVVIGDAGERAYETFSGGERSRLNVALRLALARLLANRRGAESRVLVLDEVEFLDEVGQASLVAVLLSMRDRFDRILVVSHVSGLRDAPLDAVLSVVKEDGRSRIEAAGGGGYTDATPPPLELSSHRVGAPA